MGAMAWRRLWLLWRLPGLGILLAALALCMADAPQEVFSLIDAANSAGSAEIASDGAAIFRGGESLRVTAPWPSIDPTAFSLAFALRIRDGTGGYLAALSDAVGSRFISLYYSHPRKALEFYYRVRGHTAQQVASFPTSAIGGGGFHRIVLAVNNIAVTLTVDNDSPRRVELLGLVDVCGGSLQDCVLYVGQRASASGGAFRLTGASLAAPWRLRVFWSFSFSP